MNVLGFAVLALWALVFRDAARQQINGVVALFALASTLALAFWAAVS